MFWLIACATKPTTDSAAELPEEIPAYANAGDNEYISIDVEMGFDIADSTGVEFIWDFGDGNQAQGSSATHTYTEAGMYSVVLSAIGSNGLRKTDAKTVTAHNPLQETPQLSSSIAIANNTVWGLFPDAGTLHKIDIETQSQESFPICSYPRQLMVSDAHIAITCLDSLAIFHIPSAEIETIPLPAHSSPYGVVGAQNDWWITLSAIGELAHWDGQTLETQFLGPDVRALSKHKDVLFTPRWRSAAEGGEIHRITATEHTIHPLEIDGNGDSDNTTGGLPNLLESIIPSPDGTQFYIPMLHANILAGTYLSENTLRHDNTVRAMLARLASDLQEDPSKRKHFDEKGRSIAGAFSPSGDRIYILHPGVQNASILNAYTGQFLGSLLQTGVGSTGIAVSEEYIAINSELTREIKVYHNSPPYSIFFQSIFDVADPIDPTILLGKQIFNNAADPRITKAGYISCAHCHPNGDHDGVTWDFTDRGEGLRNTTSLLGGVVGRLHWSGNFDEVQDFENDMRENFGGKGFLSDEEYMNTFR